jgi:flagellar M-ring protein FliF
MAESSLSSFRNLRQLSDLKELPLVRQLALLIGVALAIAAGLTLFFWSQQPAFVAVFPDLPPEDASALADSMQAAAIPYRVDPQSGAVTVPPERLREARMRAAAQGLPKGSAMGFELLEKDQGFGTSQFIENARYQMAIETELARTVSSLQPIKNARVHLAVQKPSAFTDSRREATASVVVDLYPGRQLEGSQIESIQHLIASSVPNLAPGAVSVIDQYGRLLSKSNDDSSLAQSTEQYQYRRRLEGDYETRIRQLLSPMIGLDRLSTQVSADLDFSAVEEASERYDPNGALRSEQTSDSREVDGRGTQGVPGALSNQPPKTANETPAAAPGAAVDPNARGDAAQPAPPTAENRQATRNFELGRTVSHRRQAVGDIKRLSVAVLVDYAMKPDANGAMVATALSDAEIAKVETLVKQAVGFSAERGDTVTVQNAPFVASQLEAPAPVPIWKRAELQNVLRLVFGALVVVILILSVVRPLLRSLTGPAPGRALADAAAVEGQLVAALPGSVSHAGAASGAQAAIPGSQVAGAAGSPPLLGMASSYEEKLSVARGAVTQDPKRVAQLVKSWVNEDG